MPSIDDIRYSEWPAIDGIHDLSDGVVSVRVHIDNMENEDADIWAVSWEDSYYTAHAVEIQAPLRGVPRHDTQPRAFLSGLARVLGVREGDTREIYLV